VTPLDTYRNYYAGAQGHSLPLITITNSNRI